MRLPNRVREQLPRPGVLRRVVLRVAGRRAPGGVALEEVLKVRGAGGVEDPLVTRRRGRRDGRRLSDPFLAEALAQDELGTWSVDRRTIEELEALVRRVRPALVLEFGSGITTLCFAHWLTQLHGAAPPDHPHVVSFDQDEDYAARTRERLQSLGLGGAAQVHHRPLVDMETFGRRVRSYDLSAPELDEMLTGRQADVVFVDGPASTNGSRAAVLPVVRRRLRAGAHILLDDALRDGELWAARMWQQMEGMEVTGISVRGHGLLFCRADLDASGR